MNLTTVGLEPTTPGTVDKMGLLRLMYFSKGKRSKETSKSNKQTEDQKKKRKTKQKLLKKEKRELEKIEVKQ